jgi:hypothetical protein
METTTENTPAIIATKEAWIKIGFSSESKIGQVMNATDLKLQAMTQKALAKIVLPKTIADIGAAEKLVTELRADYVEVQTERKKLTSKFDNATSRLMEPEKLFTPAITPLTDAIFSLKKQAEQESLKYKWHEDEIKTNKELMANHIANHDAECKKKILTLVDKAYSFALGNGDVKLEEKDEYIRKVINGPKAGESEFFIKAPMWLSKYTTQEENQELWDNAVMDVRSPMDYRQDLKDELDKKFEFYNIALKNKAESLKQAAIEKETAEAEIAKKNSEAQTANKLNAMATTHTATPVATHKDLKKGYEIDMPEDDWAVATQILAAFVGNLEKCKTYLRVKSIYRLSVDQMAESLCKVKNAELAFEFGNLKFKTVEKL